MSEGKIWARRDEERLRKVPEESPKSIGKKVEIRVMMVGEEGGQGPKDEDGAPESGARNPISIGQWS